MEIDVRELKERVNDHITALTKEHEILSEAMTATTTFTTETQDFFKGKTADATRAYLEEAYHPVQKKMLAINELMTKTLTDYLADAIAQFGANGIVDIPTVDMDYKQMLNRVTDQELEAYRELNGLIQEANEFISFSSANLAWLEELDYDMLAEITKIRVKLDDFETKWAKEFSKVTTLQDELDHMLAQTNNNTLTPTSYQAGMISFETGKAEFLSAMQTQFGFNEAEAKIMYTIYLNLRNQSTNEDETFERFFAYMGAFFYGDNEKYGYEAWGIIAGTLNEADLKAKLLELGITDREYEILSTGIINQHNVCAWDSVEDYTAAIFNKNFDTLPQNERERYITLFEQFNSKTDFAHMSVTLAAQLHSDGLKWSGSLYGGAENGIYSAEDNAGYAGDIFGVFDAAPSMSNDDYRADLDAVNLSAIISSGATDGISTITDYYNKIDSGQLNRANEFLSNVGNGSVEKGYDIIEKQIIDHTVNYSQKGLLMDYFNGGMDKVEEHMEVSLQFLKNLNNKNNEWVNYE
ncbi:TPA: T7SS effector LXG polymorphic toxin [Listeria monocytogenes]